MLTERIITKPDMLMMDSPNPVAIYCDGDAFHNKTKEQAFRDRNIDRDLESIGFVVLRFTGTEIYNNIARCVEEVKSHYLGKHLSDSPQEILLDQLKEIDFTKLNDWEKTFYYTMFDYITSDKRLSLKQEQIINRMIKKSQEVSGPK